ncbi:hypothetical protein EJ110_NYTH56062 [Nymphaea thermarum]|nr:hypothetical protein EJ110_NYTH56062 [Nymphaea thermarum]
MEVLAIDWDNIDSRFIRDDAYEGINAPKWVDFLAPEDPTDEESFFCRPDCQHPKSLADFHLQRSSSKFKHGRQTRASLLRSSSKSEATTPLREMNGREPRSKSRVLVSSSVTSLAELRSPKKTKAPYQTPFTESECENRNPNSPASVNSVRKGKFTNEFKVEKQVQRQNLVQRPAAAMKERKSEKPEPETPSKAPPLRSTHSARNLFAGRDILSQISEFCTELKKLALNGNRAAGLPVKPETAKPTTPAKERSGKESSEAGTAAAGSSSTDENQRRKPLNSSRKDRGENSSKKVEGKVGGHRPEWKITGKVNGGSSSSSKGVRSAPPTPQKFPPHPSALKPPLASPLKSSSTRSISMEERIRSLQESSPNGKMRSAGEENEEDKLTISPLCAPKNISACTH